MKKVEPRILICAVTYKTNAYLRGCAYNRMKYSGAQGHYSATVNTRHELCKFAILLLFTVLATWLPI